MEDNETKPTNVLDLIATDSSPAEITDTLKSMMISSKKILKNQKNAQI